MALAGRSPRRDGGRRLLAAGIIITLVVVVIDASLKSRSPTLAPRLAVAAWVDRVLPIIQASSTQGNQIRQIRTAGVGSLTAASLTKEMDQTALDAKRSYEDLAALRPPGALLGATGLLEACLVVRSRAAAEMAGALKKGVGNGSPTIDDPQVRALAVAGQEFQVSDRAYQLFAERLPAAGVKAPVSTWLSDPSDYQPANVAVFLASVANAAAGVPVHQITIAAVTLNPPSLNTSGGVDVLIPTNAVNISAVVANTGTQREDNLAVVATINPSAGNAVFKQTISLPPGTAFNTALGPLNPKPGAVTTLVITVTPPPGSPTAAVSRTVTFMTTVPAPTSTTAPGSGAGIPGSGGIVPGATTSTSSRG